MLSANVPLAAGFPFSHQKQPLGTICSPKSKQPLTKYQSGCYNVIKFKWAAFFQEVICCRHVMPHGYWAHLW